MGGLEGAVFAAGYSSAASWAGTLDSSEKSAGPSGSRLGQAAAKRPAVIYGKSLRAVSLLAADLVPLGAIGADVPDPFVPRPPIGPRLAAP
jgi:hypothetical protein